MQFNIERIIKLLENYKHADEIINSLGSDLEYIHAVLRLEPKNILGYRIKKFDIGGGNKTSCYNFKNNYKIVSIEKNGNNIKTQESKIKILDNVIFYDNKINQNGAKSFVSATIIYNLNYNNMLFSDVNCSNIYKHQDARARNKKIAQIKTKNHNKNALI